MRCIFYAVNQYRKNGGYIAVRRTRLGYWWPHFLWLPPDCPKGGKCEGIESFVPEEPVIRLFPPLWFKGFVKKGDD